MEQEQEDNDVVDTPVATAIKRLKQIDNGVSPPKKNIEKKKSKVLSVRSDSKNKRKVVPFNASDSFADYDKKQDKISKDEKNDNNEEKDADFEEVTLTPKNSNIYEDSASKGADAWECPCCTLLNPESKDRCEACTYKRKRTKGKRDQKEKDEKERCNTTSKKTSSPESAASKEESTSDEKSEWTCSCCTFINPITEHRCQVCLQQNNKNLTSRPDPHTNTNIAYPPLEVGDRVVIKNLTTTKVLNGLHGIIDKQPDLETGRYTLRLDSPLGGYISIVSANRQNLEKEEQDEETASRPPLQATDSSTDYLGTGSQLSSSEVIGGENVIQSTSSSNKKKSKRKVLCILIGLVFILLVGVAAGFGIGWSSKPGDDEEDYPTQPLPASCNVNDETRYNICAETRSRGKYTGGVNWIDSVSKATKRWESIIIGNLEEVDAEKIIDLADSAVIDHTCYRRLPETIDDVYICVVDQKEDGPGKVVGAAMPLVTRGDTAGAFGLPVVSFIYFDEDDIQTLLDEGILDTLLLHEMAHALGFGFFEEYGLLDKKFLNDDDEYVYSGEHACREYERLEGCVGCPPVEHGGGEGTELGHWDEKILKSELMTGYIDQENKANHPLSTVTIGAFHDIGYYVDYNQADPYESPCKIKTLRRRDGQRRRRRKLSTKGKQSAVEYGLKVLQSNHKNETGAFPVDLVYMADKYINVIVEEDGALFSVNVRQED